MFMHEGALVDVPDQLTNMTSSNKVLKEFASEASSHGIKRIIAPADDQKSSKLGRIMWCAAWLIAASYSIYQIYDVIDEYLLFQSITKYSIEDNGSVPFPAVTVCIMNPLSWTKVAEWLNDCFGVRSNERLQRICEKYSNDTIISSISNGSLPLVNQLWLRDMQFELIEHEFESMVLTLSHPIDDLFTWDINKTKHVSGFKRKLFFDPNCHGLENVQTAMGPPLKKCLNACKSSLYE